MQTIISIALGGAIGAVLRFLLSRFIGNSNMTIFPLGTFIVNIIGCFFIGILYTIFDKILVSSEFRAFLLIGLIGAFTTFSTFVLETFNLFQDKEIFIGLLNVILSNLIGFICLFLGIIIARLLFLKNL